MVKGGNERERDRQTKAAGSSRVYLKVILNGEKGGKRVIYVNYLVVIKYVWLN